jgi:hypothetical protein
VTHADDMLERKKECKERSGGIWTLCVLVLYALRVDKRSVLPIHHHAGSGTGFC